MTKTDAKLDQTKRLMGALVRMKPKPHEEIKVGKKAKESQKSKTKPKSTSSKG
jgi:hypothetical protein